MMYRAQMIQIKRFMSALDANLPVLFVNIGWTEKYDGTKPVKGRHGWLQDYPEDNGEAAAFFSDGGIYRCGIEKGWAPPSLHIVFAAREPVENALKLVGVYAYGATEEPD
jgi:hypothetical protein